MILIFIFEILFTIILCSRYPVYEKIKESKRGKARTLDVYSYEEYLEYVKKNDNVLSYFYAEFCDECEEFLPILEEASTYKIINKKWKLLKVDCGQSFDVCQNLGIYENYPMNEIYRKHELVDVELPTELIPLLELLYKLCTEPIINFKSKEDFFKNYGYYAPIVEIEKPKEENKTIQIKVKKEDDDDDDDDDNQKEDKEMQKQVESDFIECVKKIANNEFIKTFYFGMTEAKDYKEKIVFDNGNLPITYLWDGICQHAIDFLNENKYPLLYKVDRYYIKELDDDQELRILVALITFPKNTKINYLIFNKFKKLAFDNRKYLFGYIDYNEERDLFNESFKYQLNDTNEIQLIIRNFRDRSYYIHKPVFNIDNQTEREIIHEIKNLVLNMTNLTFITGSRFQDFINFIGFNNMTTTKQVIVIIIMIAICIGVVYKFGDENDYLDDDLYDYEEVEEVNPNPQTKSVKVI